MHYYEVCPIGTIAGREDTLTYSSESKRQSGTIATIPFGTRTKLGVILSETAQPSFSTKSIGESIDALPPHMVELARWLSDYYAARLPIVFQAIVPTGIQKRRRGSFKADPIKQSPLPDLTSEQIHVLDDMAKRAGTHMLHGITGSGKTRVYQELAVTTLAQHMSVLILVPEISLTSQLSNEFKKLHPNVLVLHSGLTEAERHIYWQTLRESQEQWVVVGPRSALFSPRDDFGLIIVDECHEPSYQQDSQPKYNALRVAKKLSDLLPTKPRLILGSATPSITDYFIANHTRTPIHELGTRVTTRDASVEIVDLKDPSQTGGSNILSKPVLEAMSRALTANQQVLLFHNRRGSARSGICTDCGWAASCNVCHLPMRLHRDLHMLKCHTCGSEAEPPKSCPECGSIHIDYKGFGTKRIEEEVKKRFPEVEVARFDSDTSKDSQLHKVYDDIRDNKIQIVIGTQGIAKGLDLPHLSVVGIIQAESELYVPDFSSEERAFQLITQVIGRAGRRGQKSQVFIQTYNPEHPIIQFARDENYLRFYEHAITERELEHMPPFTHLLHATIGYSTEEYAKKIGSQIRQRITKERPGVYVRGPLPAFHEHRGGKYYQQLIITSSRRSDLVEIARSLPQKWQYTLDPPNLF